MKPDNTKDAEAFEKRYALNTPTPDVHAARLGGWMAACEYKQADMDQLGEQVASLDNQLNALEMENQRLMKENDSLRRSEAEMIERGKDIDTLKDALKWANRKVQDGFNEIERLSARSKERDDATCRVVEALKLLTSQESKGIWDSAVHLKAMAYAKDALTRHTSIIEKLKETK